MRLKLYVFFLCLIIFITFVILFLSLIIWIYKLLIRDINSGLDDDKIIKEYNSTQKRRKILNYISFTINFIVCIASVFIFCFSIYINYRSINQIGVVPILKVVVSDSMSHKNEGNQYLFENNLNNQIELFDIIAIVDTPTMDELKLYDVVVYELNGDLIVHRIVGIEEPNLNHPNERYFLLQGDAVGYTDKFPVTYNQIKGIYSGRRIPFLGSFIMFLQSPAGYLAIILIIFYFIGTPILEKKLRKAQYNRLMTLGILNNSEGIIVSNNQEQKSLLFNFKVKTFEEKLSSANDVLLYRYKEIKDLLIQIANIRVLRGKKFETYKVRRIPIVKIAIKGKTLNVYLGLNPSKYRNTKYIFTDVSNKTDFQFYQMRIKISSNRILRWTKELILDIIKNNALTYVDNHNE